MSEEKKLTGYPSIDKPWLKYYSNIAKSASFKGTVYENIYESNKNFERDIALIYFGKKITYKTLFSEIDNAAKAFTAEGIAYKDNVVLCMPAVPETVYAVLALNRIGANAVLINPMFNEDQLTNRIKETNAKMIVVLNELYGLIKHVILKVGIKKVVHCPATNSLGTVVSILKGGNKKIDKAIHWNEFIKNGRKQIIPPIPKNAGDLSAIMVYSSGTTGASKGIQLRNIGINSAIMEGGLINFEWKRQDRYFSQIPIWFSTGISATVLVPLKHGISVILEPKYDFEIFYNHIKKYKPNFMISAVGLIDYLSEKRKICNAYKEFKYLVVGGEYMTPHAEEKFNVWLQANNNNYGIYKGYGMCECGGTVTASSMSCNVIGSSGIPLPHVVVSAFDLDTDRELKYGERGELRVITPCRMAGYYCKPEATNNYFSTDENGSVWACTGDMGYVDSNGCVYVLGRLSDSYINNDGETIYLFDIERTLLCVKEIRQCKTYVSQINGKSTHISYIVMQNDISSKDNVIERAVAYCKENLPSSHIPKYFKIYNSALPVAPNGKYDIEKMINDKTNIIKVGE